VKCKPSLVPLVPMQYRNYSPNEDCDEFRQAAEGGRTRPGYLRLAVTLRPSSGAGSADDHQRPVADEASALAQLRTAAST
jgi:hypothetical protein